MMMKNWGLLLAEIKINCEKKVPVQNLSTIAVLDNWNRNKNMNSDPSDSYK